MFENVVSYVGRIYVCHCDCENDNITNLENCRGTVGLIGSHGESIGCWHTIDSTTRTEHDKIYIEYPNYKQKLLFEAHVKENLSNEELDLFIAQPIEPLTSTTSYLQCALDVSLEDNVHFFGYPEVVDRQIISEYKNRNEEFVNFDIERKLRLPTVFSGHVCFNGRKQVVADYLSFPNCFGGIVVDDWGHLKGIHVASLGLMGQPNFQNLKVEESKTKKNKSKNKRTNIEKILQNLPFEEVNTLCTETTSTVNASRNKIAAFVPIQMFLKPLQLIGLSEEQHVTDLKPSLTKKNLENLNNISNEHFENQKITKNMSEIACERTSKTRINSTNLSEDIYSKRTFSCM
jgi:hypothetical protein